MPLSELRFFSERWGADFLLVQGAGGNTSLKRGDVLSVKASGFRLADALTRDVFIDVPMTAARAMADGGPAHADAAGRRASIETSLHAVMPQAVVAHLHMVAAIAIAVREDAEAVLAERLAGIDWAIIPYLKPGVAVAQAVRAILAQRGRVDVVILGNHGIVCAGDSFAKVDALVERIRGLLNVAPRVGTPLDDARLTRYAMLYDLEPARFAVAHGIAGDHASLAHATAGSLYPDHVVFLGRGADILSEEMGLRDSGSLMHCVPGAGVLLPRNLPDEAHEMAACLAEVTARIPAQAPLRILGQAAEDALVNWDAEIYRRNLAWHAG